LSSKVPIAYIDIRVFVHATEDTDKVLNALHNTLPTELTDRVVFKKTCVKGHYGNPILLLETRIRKRDAVKAIFEKLSSDLSNLDRELLNSEITQHLDKGNLYIRLDKQSACSKELKLRSDDPIHFRIHFRKSNLEEIMEICRRFGMLL